jgi:hypothetical protein
VELCGAFSQSFFASKTVDALRVVCSFGARGSQTGCGAGLGGDESSFFLFAASKRAAECLLFPSALSASAAFVQG